jgi:glycosyltransferase involved in cell wall biosynthesis
MSNLKNLPKISIVTPSYNQGHFLEECITSILNQKYPNLEYFIIDGGSTDRSLEVIKKYEDQITYWISESDHGQSDAINKGVQKASGDLVAWLNADDYYLADSLWLVARAYIRYPGRGLYIGNGYRYYQSTGEKRAFCPKHVAFSRVALTEGLDYILQPSTFILREAWQAVGGLNQNLHFGMDWDIFLRIADQYPVVTLNEFLAASREYAATKTASGGIKRAIELIQIAQQRSSKQITLGTAFYLLGSLLYDDQNNLPPALQQPLSDAVKILSQKMIESWGDETFPTISDPQDCVYLPLSTPNLPTVHKLMGKASEDKKIPTISIIIPVTQPNQFLSQSLYSILSQNYPHIEIIVIDGVSKDTEIEIPEAIRQQLIVFRSESGQGDAHAIQQGWQRASGEIVGWLAAEDMLAETVLWTVAEAFVNDPSLELVTGNAVYVDKKNELFLVDNGKYKNGLYYDELLFKQEIPAWWKAIRSMPQPTTFFRRHWLESLNFARNRPTFDFDRFWYWASQAKTKKIDQTLACYRITPAHDAPSTNRCIAIDMTLMLPGGDNGGSKILALQLLKGLHQIAPMYRLLILTASCNHDELSCFDEPEVTRLCVLQNDHSQSLPSANGFQYRLKELLSRLYQALPPRLALMAAKLGQYMIRTFRVTRLKLQRNSLQFYHPGGILSSRNVDLLFCPFTTPTYAEPNIPVVSVFYDLQHVEYPQFFTPQEISRRNAQLEQLRRTADRIICISEHTRQVLLAHLNIEPERTETIYIGAQSRLKKINPPEVANLLTYLNINRRPYIFYPANFWPHKNHQMLLVAFNMLLTRNPGLELDLIFTGSFVQGSPDLPLSVQRMGLSDRIHFLGYLPDNQLAAVFEGCKIIVFPSLYEGFGIPLIEAMFFGKPILCSNITSLPEIAQNAALLFDPRKPLEIVTAIEKVLTDHELESELIQRGFQRVSAFKLETMILSYLKVFRALMAQSKTFLDQVSGILEDGWTSDVIFVTCSHQLTDRFLELDLEVPSWHPATKLIMELRQEQQVLQSWNLQRGSHSTLRFPLSMGKGQLILFIQPTFRPSDYNIGEDTRSLGCICRSCRVIYADGSQLSLFELA